MSGARLIFVRHAEPDEWLRGRIYGRLDPGLSEHGNAHADALAADLAREQIVAVYTSPLQRARATATRASSSGASVNAPSRTPCAWSLRRAAVAGALGCR